MTQVGKHLTETLVNDVKHFTTLAGVECTLES
jgi:hypothetical protein